jgi:glycosyltransferase involved in cell wall biosynthesis
MAAGTPVVAVRNPSSEEICGEAALLVEPGELGEALARVSSDAELLERLAERGRERAARFSWERSAEHHLEAYRRAAGG